ncbi:MAG: hypothetical protein ACK2T5_10205 [Anaerolineales bacterium]
MKKFLKTLGAILGSLVLILVIVFAYWYLRPNRAEVNPDIVLRTWAITKDDFHNSNTDMIQWDDVWYLSYVSSPYHFGNDDSVMHVIRSYDQGETWEETVTFNPPDEDIRDPKFAIIGDKLFLYALKNTSFVAEPYISVYSFSEDGITWTDFADVPDQDGWLFWRPKTQDGETFYNAAYWWEHGKSVLLKSTDGINWEIISTINEGERNDETEIEFLSDGRMLATARLEYAYFADGAFGDKRGATLITVSEPPYETWTELTQSLVTRLDGPYLFTYNDRVYALGRYQPDLGKSGLLTDQGSILSRKRTAIFEVREDGLAYLTDLPSDGDTSYVGLVMDGDRVFATYYTSPINHDFPWIMGMFSASEIRMAEIDIAAMEALADKTVAE